MEKIPLSKVEIGEEEKRAVIEVLESGWLTHGSRTKEFERIFCEYIGVKHAVAMNSCASALFLSILAHNIRGEVILPSFTFAASANAVLAAGASPRFCEVERDTCNVSARTILPHINNRTEAIMVVHFAGLCCQMDQISALCKEKGLLLIEDSAETIGGLYNNRSSGSWGEGCWSFFPTKNITTGEGGMFTSNDDGIVEKIRKLIGHGIETTTQERLTSVYPWQRVTTVPGYNFRMSNILAALGVEQMRKLDSMNARRRALAKQMTNEMAEIEGVECPTEPVGFRHVYQMFTIKLDPKLGNRNDCVTYLRAQGVGASVHFDPPVHKHPLYQPYVDSPLPVTEKISREIVTLPMYPSMSQRQASRVVKQVLSWIRKNQN